MSFEGIAGLHCLVLPAYVLIPDDILDKHPNTCSYWLNDALRPLNLLSERIRAPRGDGSRMSLKELIANGGQDSKIMEAFDQYCCNLHPFSQVPTNNNLATQSSVNERSACLREIMTMLSPGGRIAVKLRDPNAGPLFVNDSYSNPSANTDMDEPYARSGDLSWLNKQTSQKLVATPFSDPIVVYNDSSFPMIDPSLASRLVTNVDWSQAVLRSFFEQNTAKMSPHLVKIRGFGKTIKTWFVIPIAFEPEPTGPLLWGRKPNGSWPMIWVSFCTMLWHGVPNWAQQTPSGHIRALGWEIVQKRSPTHIQRQINTVETSSLRDVKLGVALRRSAWTPSPERPMSAATSEALYYQMLDDVFSHLKQSFYDTEQAYKFDFYNEVTSSKVTSFQISDQMMVMQTTRLAEMDFVAQSTMLKAKAHNFLFCTRMPTTMWNHPAAFPFEQDLTISSVDPAEYRQVAKNVLGAGVFGVVATVRWIFTDDPDGGFSHLSAPGMHNMAIINELTDYVRDVGRCLTKNGGINLKKLHVIAPRIPMRHVGIEINGPELAYGSFELPVAMIPTMEHVAANARRLVFFYNAAVNFAKSVIYALTGAEASKYVAVYNVSERQATSSILINAYKEYSALMKKGGIPGFERPNKHISAIEGTVKGAYGRVLIKTHMSAALKSSTGHDDFVAECAIMQYFAAYKFSPLSIGAFYASLQTRLPLLDGLGVSRNMINQTEDLRRRYLSAVHPEDRSRNPRAYIQPGPLGGTLEMVIVDDDGTVIAKRRNMEPFGRMAQSMLDLSMFLPYADESREGDDLSILPTFPIPPAASGVTCPAYGVVSSPTLAQFTPADGSIEARLPTKSPRNVMLLPKKGGSLSEAFRNTADMLGEASSIAGVTMTNHVAGGGTPVMTLLQIVVALADIAGGLAFINNHGVSHMDFKPHNTLVDSENRISITDFGHAKFYGTVGYHAAERYVPSFYAKSLGVHPHLYVFVKDSTMDAMAFGGMILADLFGLERNEFNMLELTNHLQHSSTVYGPSNMYDILGNVLTYRPQALTTSPLLHNSQVLSFGGFEIVGEDMPYLVDYFGTQGSDVATCMNLSVVRSNRTWITKEKTPVNPLIVEYVVQQIFDIGRWMYGAKLENLEDGEASQLDGDAVPRYRSKFPDEQLSMIGAPRSALDDMTTMGYGEEWYRLSEEKRRAYGFMTNLKVAETQLRILAEIITKDQALTFAGLRAQAQ